MTNKHRIHYIDMEPQPLTARWVIACGVCFLICCAVALAAALQYFDVLTK